MTKYKISLFILCWLGFILRGSSALLFSKPAEATNNFNSASSAKGNDGSGYRAFNDFHLPVAAQITRVSWVGFYRDTVNQTNNPAPPQAVSWNLGFYFDAGGLPASVLQIVTIPASNVTSQVIGNAVSGAPVEERIFTANLPTPVVIPNTNTFWFSPLSVQPTYNPLFAWWSSSGSASNTFSMTLNSSNTFFTSRNRAFTLEGDFDVPVVSIQVSQVSVCWTTVAGLSYQLQYRSSLTTNIWTDLGNPILGNGSNACVPDSVSAEAPQRFYRVIQSP